MLSRVLYAGWILPLLGLGLPAAALWSPKVRATLRARRGVWRRLRAAAERRDPARGLVWCHVASAGELLQAEPVLRRCAAAGLQTAVTVTSVSGLRWRQRLDGLDGLIWLDVLPLDTPPATRRLMAALRPSAMLYVQADLWPGLMWAAVRRDVPQVLIAARLGRRSARLRRPLARAFYRPLYRRLRVILALSEGDRERLGRLVPGHAGLETAGDPGIETALHRAAEAAPPALPAGFARNGGPVLVAGSTWPADERRWVPLVQRALARLPALRLVVAPHEPDEGALGALEAALADAAPVRLSAVERGAGNGETRAVLVDSVGRLASLYRAGTVAYVGGAFTTGVHNVAEPAAAGLPVVFGPRHENSAVAGALLAGGAAWAVHDEAELEAALLPLLDHPDRAREAGERARGVIARLAGAAERCADAVLSAASRA